MDFLVNAKILKVAYYNIKLEKECGLCFYLTVSACITTENAVAFMRLFLKEFLSLTSAFMQTMQPQKAPFLLLYIFQTSTW